MKIKNKVDLSKLLSVTIFGLGLLTTALTNKNNAIEREAMKNELKEELLKELASN